MKFTLNDEYQKDAVRDVLANLKKARKRWRDDHDRHAFSLTAPTGAGNPETPINAASAMMCARAPLMVLSLSETTGSPRLAVNPPNAMLNYLYAVLESESRLAAAALGLDPGIGVLHVDTPARDSLACDLMEVVRPQVDAFLLDWITRETLKREWFLEQGDGNCRLMAQLAIKLSETAPTWGRAIGPGVKCLHHRGRSGSSPDSTVLDGAF